VGGKKNMRRGNLELEGGGGGVRGTADEHGA